MAAGTPLIEVLRRALATHPRGHLCVGYSGGGDSTALLHALASLDEARARGLRAIHVDHGLNADSAAWAELCTGVCRSLEVPLAMRRVCVERAGHGLEAAARAARYAAFAEMLEDAELLLLAHHRNDQAETVLLKLLRGAGPAGLGGMRPWRPLGRGHLWRPLLDLPRQVLADYATDHALRWIDDPGNRTPTLARNFLRAEIVPRLRVHWPEATLAVSHGAALSRAAADYIDRQARDALETLRHGDGSLDATGWSGLHEALRGPVLEQWLRDRGLPVPTRAQSAQVLHQVRHAPLDRVPRIAWPGAELYRWRGRLHAMAPLAEVPADWCGQWCADPLPLPSGGTLSWSSTPHARPDLRVRLGERGVHLRPSGDPHTRELRDLFQQAAVPPWLRRRCPLIYDVDGTLLGVADLWTTAAGESRYAAMAARPAWQRPG